MSKMHGPWTILKSTVKYTNPWMTVREDNVLRPDGKPDIFGTVLFKPGSSVLPIDDEGNVYLVEEFQYAIGRKSVEVASGGMNTVEAPLACAKRELHEELGIQATEWISLGYVDPFTSVVHSPDHMFLARGLTVDTPHPEGTETGTVVKIPFIKALEWVMQGKITHATSCVLILKAKEYLNL